MKNLYRTTSSNCVLCLLLLTAIGFTRALSPNQMVLRPIQRISTIRSCGENILQPRRSFELTCLRYPKDVTLNHKRDKPSLWKRISQRRRRFQQILLPTLGVFFLLPMRAMASEDAFCPIPASLEFRLTLRLVVAAFLGAGLGKERSIAKHSAGVRTMALVAMGASTFTVCSLYGFNIFGAKHDPGRMASQVASGVGFVGAGVITSTSHMNGRNIVHGLTTAATIWLSAAVGVACGTGLYQVATAAAALTVFILRLGRIRPLPKSHWSHGTNANPRQRFIPSELSATPLDDDNDTFAETHDTAEWDEHHYTVQKILDDEMPPKIQQVRRKIEEENHRISIKREADDLASKVKHHKEPKEKNDKKIVVVQDPEIAEIMQHAWKNHTNHQDIHIKNMQRFSDFANKTVATSS